MRDMVIEKKMYDAAVALIQKRYPTGWGGAAVIHTKEDSYFTSVAIETANASAKVLTPCGICQERLRFWGDSVQVGVTTNDSTPKFVTLKELQPYHWTDAYSAEDLERFVDEN